MQESLRKFLAKAGLSVALLAGAYVALAVVARVTRGAGQTLGQDISRMLQQAGRFQDLDTTATSRIPVVFEGRQIAMVLAQMAIAPLVAQDSGSGFDVAQADAAVTAMLGPEAGAVGAAIQAAWVVRPAGTVPAGLAALLVDSGPSRLYAGQYSVSPPPPMVGLVAHFDSAKNQMHLTLGSVHGRLAGQLWLGQPVATIPVVDR
jgi:hypothetical protein